MPLTPPSGTARELPGDGVSDEIIHQGELSRVFRRKGESGSVIWKEFLGPNAVQRLRHERRIMERLRAVEGVPRLVEGVTLPCAIAFQDDGSLPLGEVMRMGALPAGELLALALQLASILSALHRAGVAHRNLAPGNLLFTPASRRVMLIDFSLATTFAEERPGFVHHREIAGELPYLAPEQTGRTAWGVDLRADLYGLGATIYEFATGRPPFQQQDPLQLIHDILAVIPAAPASLNRSIPRGLSNLVLRLLEKEPQRRYQSAEGVAHDLARLQQGVARREEESFPLGARDFPLRLSPPSRLIGRELEKGALLEAFEASRRGSVRCLLIAGSPGVGKSALIGELRPAVAARGGFFVSGKFDQHRRDPGSDAVQQALRALGSLLLAEPEQELAALRREILQRVGGNAGILTARLPELALLLQVPAERSAGDPLQDKDRLIRAGVDLLRGVASAQRPVVLVLDDLQWAAPTPIALMEALLDEGVPGLFLVGAYREAELGEEHPLNPLLSRRGNLGAPLSLKLGNLPRADLARLLGELLRLPPSEASLLAEPLLERTGGNPYDTVELVNALRRDGKLTPAPQGWSWDAELIRSYVGSGDVVDLLADRIERLPLPARQTLEVMASLGGELQIELLRCACGLEKEELEERLAPSLQEGLLVLEQGGEVLSFRHDRVQQAAYRRLTPAARRALHLELARRLARHPQFAGTAAEQYLPAASVIEAAAERRLAAGLFRQAAAQARLIQYALAEKFLAAAMSLLGSPEASPDPLFAAIVTQRHCALYSLGCLEEADEMYALIEALGSDPLELVEAACVQVGSLINRGRGKDALALALPLLRRLGVAVPQPEELSAEVERRLELFYEWVRQDDQEGDLQRPELADPQALAAAKLMSRVIPASFFCDQTMLAWLVTEAARIWGELAPAPHLVGPLCHVGHLCTARGDFRTGYQVMRRALAVAVARGYQAETGQGRFLFSMLGVPWLEPIEESVRQVHWARETLMRSGDLQFACFSFFASLTVLLDCAPTLEGFAAELEAGFAFAARTGNDFMFGALAIFRQLLRALKGETAAPGSFDDAEFDEREQLAALSATPANSCTFHLKRALSAAIFGEEEQLKRHAWLSYELLQFNEGVYSTATIHLLRGLSLANEARRVEGEQRERLLEELDGSLHWLARRAEDAPENFLHLRRLLEAERAWSGGDFRGALCAFDAALCAANGKARRWHRALICERAAIFHLEHALKQSGGALLAEARQLYESWGAAGKVGELERRHPQLRLNRRSEEPRASVSGDAVDLMAVLRASQALSSGTELDRLRAQVEELLGTLTGATSVRLVLWQEQHQDWALVTAQGSGTVRLRQSGCATLLPVSVFRYVERIREPLLLEDAASDPRFRQDPYLAQLDQLSLLVVPILNHGGVSAMLLLENRLSRGAFSADRLDAVTLIAGQLAVSLENAMLYEKLEERVRERTRELQEAQSELISTARRAGMAEIASNVLHNVGNVLNSVNISAGVVAGALRKSRLPGLSRAVRLMQQHSDKLGDYLSLDEKGKHLPAYLEKLALALAQEQQGMQAELSHLCRSIDHIKEIVATQQCYAGGGSFVERVKVQQLIEDALRMNLGLAGEEVAVEREFGEIPVLPLDKARLLQILVNLFSNARQAMDGVPAEQRRISIRGEMAGERRLRITISDRGEGIPAGELERIFSHGFTTRKGGHGFGLHSCALAVADMGGSLTAASEGTGRGASFTLELPVEARELGHE
jgi:predicted ATPase/signal transduction histidine kinase